MNKTQKEIPVILKLYDLILWTIQHTAKFPRHHRYSLGTKVESTLLDLLDIMIEARYSKDKVRLLDRANIVLERFRFQSKRPPPTVNFAPSRVSGASSSSRGRSAPSFFEGKRARKATVANVRECKALSAATPWRFAISI